MPHRYAGRTRIFPQRRDFVVCAAAARGLGAVRWQAVALAQADPFGFPWRMAVLPQKHPFTRFGKAWISGAKTLRTRKHGGNPQPIAAVAIAFGLSEMW